MPILNSTAKHRLKLQAGCVHLDTFSWEEDLPKLYTIINKAVVFQRQNLQTFVIANILWTVVVSLTDYVIQLLISDIILVYSQSWKEKDQVSSFSWLV